MDGFIWGKVQYNIFKLIGGMFLPPWKRCMKVSWDHHPNYWGKYISHVPNHQPVIYTYIAIKNCHLQWIYLLIMVIFHWCTPIITGFLMLSHQWSAANFHLKVGDESLVEHGFSWVVKPGQNIPCDCPLVICNIAIENDHRNSGFTHWKWCFSNLFHSFFACLPEGKQ